MGQFLGKSCVWGDGLCSTRTCRWGQWAGIFKPSWPAATQREPRQQSRAWPGPPLLPLSTPSTACICTACARVFKCSSFLKLLVILSSIKLLALILKMFIRFGRRLCWHCQNSSYRILSRDAALVVEGILIFFFPFCILKKKSAFKF